MNKDLKEFLKYLCLLGAVYFVDETIKYYVPLDLSGKFAWVGILAFAFFLFLIYKSK